MERLKKFLHIYNQVCEAEKSGQKFYLSGISFTSVEPMKLLMVLERSNYVVEIEDCKDGLCYNPNYLSDKDKN